MRNLLQKQNLYTTFVSIAVLFFALVPISVFAEVVPLAPLPTNFGSNTDTLGGYINTIFYTIIAAAAVLAVLRIVWGGFQYMTSEAVSQTKDSRTIITMAVLGLILLLGSWLVLNIINPNLTRLEVLEFENFEQADTRVDFNVGSETLTAEEIDAQLQDDRFQRIEDSVLGDRLQSVTDVTGATSRDLANLSNACAAKGSEYSSSVGAIRVCRASEAGTRYGRQVAAGEEYRTSLTQEQLAYGADFSVAARCNFGDDLIQKERYFICEKDI